MLSPTAVADAERRLQTRRFDDIGGAELLAAAISVLQDLGFQISASQKQIGLVVASKQRPMEDVIKQALTQAFREAAKLGLGASPVHQVPGAVDVLVAVQPAAMRGARSHFLRVQFLGKASDPSGRRLIWVENIKSPILYEQFFVLLSKTIAREAQGL